MTSLGQGNVSVLVSFVRFWILTTITKSCVDCNLSSIVTQPVTLYSIWAATVYSFIDSGSGSPTSHNEVKFVNRHPSNNHFSEVGVVVGKTREGVAVGKTRVGVTVGRIGVNVAVGGIGVDVTTLTGV